MTRKPIFIFYEGQPDGCTVLRTVVRGGRSTTSTLKHPHSLECRFDCWDDRALNLSYALLYDYFLFTGYSGMVASKTVQLLSAAFYRLAISTLPTPWRMDADDIEEYLDQIRKM